MDSVKFLAIDVAPVLGITKKMSTNVLKKHIQHFIMTVISQFGLAQRLLSGLN